MSIASAPWRGGRLDDLRGAQQLLFGRVYEDCAIEERAFPPGSRVFCIASAGCTAIALARERRVTAIDINPVQLAYAERRAEGAPAREGAAERIMSLGRPLLSLAGWSRGRLEEFLSLSETSEQLVFWRRHLDTRRFRWALAALLSPRWLKAFYAPGLLRALPEDFPAVLRRRMERCWSRHPNRENPYARALLLADAIIPAVRRSGIVFSCADAAEYLESCSPRSFEGFALSNILDGAQEDYRRRLYAAVRRAAAPGAIAVRRSFAEPENGEADRSAEDRCFLWGTVEVSQVGA